LPAIVITPTVFSGLLCVFAPLMSDTASVCATSRVGVKSPLRVNSLLSTQTIVASSGMAAAFCCTCVLE